MSVQAANDGRALLHDFGGCPTEHVLAAAGLSWTDLFPPTPAGPYQTRPRPPRDPQGELRRRAERGLRRWADEQGRALRDEVYQRYRLITLGERLLSRGDQSGWDLMGYAYRRLDFLEWGSATSGPEPSVLELKRPRDTCFSNSVMPGKGTAEA